MKKLSIDKILDNIKNEICFEAIAQDESFSIKIENYVPYVCAAVHDGHQFRDELFEYCLHSEYERWYEEDPCTKQMIHSHPIVLAGKDSRFEYDLNRHPDTAIYEDAWGKQLWKSTLPSTMISKSLNKHTNFYKIVNALIAKLESKFSKCIVFDMHSYNWKRWEREVPTWNLGTANINNSKYGSFAIQWQQSLSTMQLPNGIKSSSAINDTFQGNGYFLKYITSNFVNTLVLATEVSKIYCDELDGTIYHDVVEAITTNLSTQIPQMAKQFYDSPNV